MTSVFKAQIFSMFILFIIAACDKKGDPLPSDIKFSSELNGMKYKDEMPMVIPPGAKRTPILEIVRGNMDYINMRSHLKPEDSKGKHGNFSLHIRLPFSEEIVLNKAYSFNPIAGKEVMIGSENLIYLDEAMPFVSISSSSFNLDSRYYGRGTLIFTEYDLVKNKAKGRVEFVFPYDIWDSSTNDVKMSGEFHCWIQSAD